MNKSLLITSLSTGRRFKTIPTLLLLCVLAIASVQSSFAASQTWSNAPVSGSWSNVLNWVGATGVPGQVGFSTGGQNGDTMTFNSPLFGGIGGVSIPFQADDTNRQVKYIIFDTSDCGSYYLANSAAGVIGLSTTVNTAPGGVAINAGVVNPQVIESLTLRLANSSDAACGFTNNSSDPSATLTINNITNTSANSRPQFITLAGSNTGNNTIGHIDDVAGANGAIIILKRGPGKWVLPGANDLPQKTSNGNIARAEIYEGTLVVQNAASLGSYSAANLQVSNSVLQIDGVTLNNIGLTLRNGGNVRMNGSGILSGLTVANQIGNNCTVSTVNASDVFTVGEGLAANWNVNGGSSDSVLNTAGPGTVVIGAGASNPNTYIGSWVLGAATNACNVSPFGSVRNVHLPAGSLLDFSPIGSYTFQGASFTASGSGTTVGGTASAIDAGAGGTFSLLGNLVSLNYSPTFFSGDTAHPVLYVTQGSIAFGGNTIVVNNTSGTPLGLGTYRLVEQASGSITSGGSYSVFVVGSGLLPNGVASIVASGGNLDMVVTTYVSQALKWKGGNPNAVWDLQTTANFDFSGSFSMFTNLDNVIFDSLGSANPTVTLSGNLSPRAVVVDTSANDYTLSGSGSIAGQATLTKINSGVLTLSTVNTYLDGTTISGGTLRVGVDNAIPSLVIPGASSSPVVVNSPGIIDLNGYTNVTSGVSGDGTVDIQSGGVSTLTVGNGEVSSTFAGLLTNSSGTLGLQKIGVGQLILSGVQGFSGPAVVSAGTLVLSSSNAISSASTLNIVNGSVRIGASQTISNLTGAFGTSLANASGAGANTITALGTTASSTIISDGASGTIGIYVPSGNSLTLHGAGTYSGGTVVASGATLGIGATGGGINVAGAAGTGGIIASNGATVSLPTALGVAGNTGSAITNIDAGGTIFLPSASQGNSYNGQFVGGVNNTNVFSGPLSIGGNYSFANFLGTVFITNGASVRWFQGTGIDAGGDNTTFLLEGNLFHRDPRNARLGALIGNNGSIGGPSTPPGTWTIGAKNLSTTFSGSVVASNNIVKVGTESLTLNGVTIYTNNVALPGDVIVGFALKTNRVSYTGTTTVSNGTLRVVAPNNLTTSSMITVAGGTLDASQIGYFTNQTTADINAIQQPTNTVVVVSGELEILSGRTLNGRGSILGSVKANAGSIVNLGRPQGTLAVSGTASLNGAVNVSLNRSGDVGQKNGAMTATSFSGSGATLTVTNAGATLVTGDTFQLFNGPVTAFTTVNLPVASADNSITYQWENNLTSNGSIKVLLGASAIDTTPTNITVSVSGDTMTLSWPPSHTGWTLWTNAGDIANAGDWHAYPPSTTEFTVDLTIDPTKANVFFQLRYQP